MKFLSEASIRGTPFSDFIKDEVKRTESWSDSFFRHDTLGDINQPFYFHEFMSAANQAGLQYLSESEYHSTVIDNFSPFIKEYLTKLDGDPVFREQHVDFIQNRIFRETLLCCESARLDRQIETSRFKSLFFAASVQPLSASLSINSETIEDFKAPDQTILSVSDPLAKAVLKVFADHWPKPVNYEELFSGVNKLLDKKHILRPGQLLLLLKRNFTVGLLKIFSEDVSLVKTISKKPKVSDLVRYQAAHQLWVTNQLHEYVPIDNLGHHILPLLNGQNDMDALVNALFEIVRQGKITLQKAGEKLIEPDQIESVLREQLVFSLDQFASRALLIK